MLMRNCAGGVVFHEDTVFLLQNDKEEWVLPKGVIRGNARAPEVAIARVQAETGVDARILCAAGETNYEFYSITRHKPVCNRIVWFIMEAASARMNIAFEQGFLDGGFFPIEQALEKITYSQDRSLLAVACERRRQWHQTTDTQA